MAEFISPNDLNNDPKRWLNVPHVLHESLLKLQEILFPGFSEKLKSMNIHCLECEGKKPFPVIIRATTKEQICTGYVGSLADYRNILLHCTDK